jgi:CRISPR/Cas system-associated exonuclease Cas4 (RecB family)
MGRLNVGNNNDHHEFSPSKFPQFEQCLHFESGESGEAANRGTLQHTRLEALLKSTDPVTLALEISQENKVWCLDNLTKTEVNQVDYAYYKVLSLMSKHGATMESLKPERKVVAFTSDFTMTEGTADVTFVGTQNDLVVCDYKSGLKRDYSGQMKIYMLGVAQEYGLESHEKVTGYAIYGREKDCVAYEYTVAEMQEYFDSMMAKLSNRDQTEPCPNDYCGWCGLKAKCKARNNAVKEVAKVVSEEPPFKLTVGMNLETLDGSKIGKLLVFSKVVALWCKDVEEEVKSRLNSGKQVEGWEMKESSTKGFLNNTEVFQLVSDLGEDAKAEFVKALSISQKAVKETVGNEIFKEKFLPLLKVVSTNKTLTKIGAEGDTNE